MGYQLAIPGEARSKLGVWPCLKLTTRNWLNPPNHDRVMTSQADVVNIFVPSVPHYYDSTAHITITAFSPEALKNTVVLEGEKKQ